MTHPSPSDLRRSLAARLLLAASALSACAGLACVTTLESSSSLEETASLYRAADGTRALAVAVDAGGNRVWSVAEAPLQRSANSRALEGCTERAAQRGLSATCHLIAESDQPAAETVAGCREQRLPEPLCRTLRELAPQLRP